MRRLAPPDGSPGTPVVGLPWVVLYAGWWSVHNMTFLFMTGMDRPMVERTFANGVMNLVLGFALVTWTLLRVLGRVSGESAAGLFVAGVALLLRHMTDFVVGYVQLHPESVPAADSVAASWIVIFRHTGTFAFGVGLAFTAGACWADLRRPPVP